MSYEDAYARLIDSALTSLDAIEGPEDVQPFILQISTQLNELSVSMPEFYIGEFFNMFKDVVVERFSAASADCERALREANAEAATVSADLQARLATAHAAGDRAAEHAVWREREVRQAACQAKVDAVTKRADVLGLRLGAFQELVSAMGGDFV
jgi:hypothetical protein